MRPGASHARVGAGALLWFALCQALVLIVLRESVLARFGPDGLTPAGALSGLLRLPGSLLVGLGVGYVVLRARRPGTRLLALLLLAVVVFLESAAAHYEAAFGSLPDASVTRFLPQFALFSSSAAAAAPPAWVAAEVLLSCAVLAALAAFLDRRRLSEASRNGPRFVAAGASALSLAFVVLMHAGGLGLLGPARVWDSRSPLVWYVQTAFARPSPSLAVAGPLAGRPLPDFRGYQHLIGIRPPFASLDPAHPLCADGPREARRPGNGRSVMFVVLESVGRDEMELVRDGREVMPNLQRVARGAFSAQRFIAAGGHSGEALVALLAGLPPQTAGYALWRRPMNAYAGLPLDLVEHGYRTAYLHGGDLAFEQKDIFLAMVGFQELRGFRPDDPAPANAWGYADELMFGRTREWIEAHRAARGDAPYFLAFATLSTHHPFRLPASWQPRFPGADQDAQFADALSYLDTQFGAFHEWFELNEAPRGTLLVLVGDHAPHLAWSRATRTGAAHRVDTCFIVEGLDESTRPDWPRFAARLGAQQDVPATLRALLDIEPGQCDQGVDVFMPEERWPADRVLHAVAGQRLQVVHVFAPIGDAVVDTERGVFQGLVVRGDAAQVAPAVREALVDSVHLLREVNGYLYARDAYTPPPSTLESRRPPLPRAARPLGVAPCGVPAGEPKGPQAGANSIDCILRAVDSGAEWVAVDLVLTADHVAVLLHETEVDDASGVRQHVFELTLEQLRALPGRAGTVTLDELLAAVSDRAGLLLEARPQRHLAAKLGLSIAIAEGIEGRDPQRFLVSSSDVTLTSRLAAFTRSEALLGLPADRPIGNDWLATARLAGADWIEVRGDHATPALIARAHAQGLKVLVDLVDHPDALGALSTEWPDGVLARDLAVQARFEQLQAAGASRP